MKEEISAKEKRIYLCQFSQFALLKSANISSNFPNRSLEYSFTN